MNTPTPHIAAKQGEIAPSILLPGDPLRAKFIAENFLAGAKQFNATRNMFGYTGTYKGKEVSIMGSGMGMPSIGIYSYELFHFYDVENIICIRSCGSFTEDVPLRDIIIVQGACTDSNYAHQYELPGTYSAISDYSLLEKAVEKAKEKNLTFSSYMVDCAVHGNNSITPQMAVRMQELVNMVLEIADSIDSTEYIRKEELRQKAHDLDGLFTSVSPQEKYENLQQKMGLFVEGGLDLWESLK